MHTANYSILLLAANQSGTTYFIIAVVMLGVIYILMRSRGKGKDPLQQSVPRMSMTQRRNVERQMESLLVELSQMARQLSGQLDMRAAKLELLIKEADEKLAALAAATGRGTTTPFEDAAVEAMASTTLPAAEKPVVPASPPRQHADVYQLADQGHTAQEIARQLQRPSGEVELILALRTKE